MPCNVCLLPCRLAITTMYVNDNRCANKWKAPFFLVPFIWGTGDRVRFNFHWAADEVEACLDIFCEMASFQSSISLVGVGDRIYLDNSGSFEVPQSQNEKISPVIYTPLSRCRLCFCACHSHSHAESAHCNGHSPAYLHTDADTLGDAHAARSRHQQRGLDSALCGADL
jgi:hypothetical protein